MEAIAALFQTPEVFDGGPGLLGFAVGHGRAELVAYAEGFESDHTDGAFMGLFMLHAEECRAATATIVAPLGLANATATFPFGTGRPEPVFDSLNLLGAGKKLAVGVQARFVWTFYGERTARWDLAATACGSVT